MAREWEEKQEEMTPEEIAAMEEHIPEWKRNALVVGNDDEEEQEKKRGYIGRMKAKVGAKINETEAAQNFYQSEEYKKIEDMRKEAKEFKEELREHMDASHNPVVRASATVVDKVANDSPCAQAISAMQRYDPDFKLEELADEASEIF